MSIETLPHVQPILLLQTLVGVSQALNGSAVHAESVARVLIADGRRRLSGLRGAVPHLSLSLDQLSRLARLDERKDEDLSAEESAARALLEVCLGLVLRWLSKRHPDAHATVWPEPSTLFLSIGIPSLVTPLLLIPPLRARACPI